MSGDWWGWVAGPQGTTVLALCALVLGMILGYLTGRPAGWRAAERDRAEIWTKQLRAPWPPDTATGYLRGVTRTMAGTAIDPPYRSGTDDEEWEPVHVGQALALVRDDLTDSAYTQHMADRFAAITAGLPADTDAWLAEHVYGVPYSADELWSGQ